MVCASFGGGDGAATTFHFRFVNVNLPMLGLIRESSYLNTLTECNKLHDFTWLTELTYLFPMHPLSTSENIRNM